MHTLTPSPVPAGGPGVLEVLVETRDGVAVAALRGPLDIYTSPGFGTRLEPLAGPQTRLVVDLTAVTILDSSGLGALLRLRNRMDACVATQFGIVCPRRRMRRIFDITGLRAAFVMERELAGVLRAWEAADVA